MKKRFAIVILLTLILVSCGTRSGYFSIDGHLLNLNQGEFYVYSPDGIIDGVDTIKVDGGRFAYEAPCSQAGTIVLVFPNFSELPVFVQPGHTAKIKGDAYHLKEIEVSSGKDNKIMTGFRQQIAEVSPPEIIGYAERFVKDNPQSLASVYVLRKYFVTASDVDYSKVVALAELLQKEQPQNADVARMLRFAKQKQTVYGKTSMPSFSVLDIKGKTVNNLTCRGKITVVFTMADWCYESRNTIYTLQRLSSEFKNRLAVIGVSLDASVENCRLSIQGDSVATSVICDQKMFDTPLYSSFAFSGVPDNVVYDAGGKLVCHGLDVPELETRLRSMLK
ncbi:MAG: DUF4369 domain-containing protein [Prevotella sp.]